MPRTSPFVEALSLPHKALYSLYFDALSSSRNSFAQAARTTIRSVYFETRENRPLPLVPLGEWLSLVSSRSSERRRQVILPDGLFDTEGVGSLSYFYVLAELCSVIKPERIVEFGTFMGAGTLVMALNCDAQILTLDLPEEVTEKDINTLAADRGLVAKREGRTGAFYKSYPESTRISELRCDSRTIKLNEHIASVDICLVDGGHSLECVRADTENSLSVLAPGGIILWDDYFWRFPELVSYIEDFAKTHEGVVRIRGTGLVAWQSPRELSEST